MSTGTGLQIKVNDAAVLAVLNQLAQSCSHLSPALGAIGMRLEENVQRRFGTTRRDPNGEPWAQHRPGTTKIYNKKDTNEHGKVVRRGTLLVRSGDMRKGLGHSVQGNVLWVGFDKDYAPYHEHGTRKMVRRGMLLGNASAGTLGAEDVADVLDILNAFLAQAMT